MEKEELIINKLDMLKKEIDSLKDHIVDVTLTQEDLSSLNQAEEDLRQGRTKRL
jgi:transcriptional regulator of NAD metabolism